MKNSIPIIIRYIISILFLVSAIAKLFPFEMMTGIEKGFVQGQLIPMGFSETLASYFSRFIIAIEFFIAFTILQTNYLKKLIIPSSILLVSLFSLHLFYKIILGDSGNCGCFGELIPMTPLEALIKNILTIIALVYLYKNTVEENISFNKLVMQLLGCMLFMYSLFPVNTNAKNQRVSSFSKYVESEIDINYDKKILCFFDAGCEHCMQAAKSLKLLSDSIKDFPQIHIIFSDSEKDRIPDFFNFVGKEYSYQVIPFYNDDDEINSYLEIVGLEYDNPVIIYLNNGNQIRFYDGSGKNKLNSRDLKNILE
tara:strand:- start:772 stop:1701 length:930 start_codon:yes stop_codon:yes gene_type:complete